MFNSNKFESSLSTIPSWSKVMVTLCILSWWNLLSRAFYLPQQSYFGLPYKTILPILGSLVIVSSVFLMALWFFPKNRAILFLLWSFRYLRELVVLFALCGLLYYTIKLPLFNFRGGVPHLNFLLLFSNSGGIPLLNIILFVTLALAAQPTNLAYCPSPVFERLATNRKKFVERVNIVPTWILGLLIAILPIFVVCAIIYLGLGAKLSDYRPFVWNDATSYWVWVKSFSNHGFNVGYNVANEMIAPAAFNHYGEGSPFYIYIYGFIGQLVGWSPQLPILINFGLLSGVIYWFTRYLKFNSTQIILTGLVTLIFWPILIFLPTSSQETLNQVLGFIIAAIFYVLLSNKTTTPFLKILFVFLLFIAALIRLSWGLLFFPLLFLCIDGNLLRKSIISIFGGIVLLFGITAITRYLVPPLQNSIFSILEQTISIGPTIIISYFVDQIKFLLRVDQITPNLVVVFELFIILSWSLLRLWKFIKIKSSFGTLIQTRTMFDIYNVVTLLIAGMSLYLVDGFFRTFIPPLLVIVLLQVANKDYKMVTALLLVNILFAASFLNYHAVNYFGNYDTWRTNYTAKFPQIAQSQSAVDKYIVFDREAKNPWCNTILIPLDYYDYRVTMLPPGIGVSYIYSTPPNKSRLKSKYLLFDQKTFETLTDNENLNSELLASLPIGNLYFNLDSGCEIKL